MNENEFGYIRKTDRTDWIINSGSMAANFYQLAKSLSDLLYAPLPDVIEDRVMERMVEEWQEGGLVRYYREFSNGAYAYILFEDGSVFLWPRIPLD